jgi:hypothetical protein
MRVALRAQRSPSKRESTNDFTGLAEDSIMKKGCIISIIALLLVICLALGIAGFFLSQTPPARPSVLITSPQTGERVAVGQATIIHAVARGDTAQKIKRIELWIDGKLQDAQSSNVPGGVSPLPLVVNWRPATPGAHNVIVRAYNTQNVRAYASLNVEAVQSSDRDNDRTPDAMDGCPDQPGLTTNNGCPVPSTNDRDGDGVLDSSDACPDQLGSTLADGCPDVDGDGVRDSGDACPREPGLPDRNGCPAPGDADGDGVPDASDACPRETGHAETNGCPDRDGDGVVDRDDACPDTPGLPGQAGCPDRDNDSVRDMFDLCPDVPGVPTNAGCPVSGTADRDGDGVRDDTDLSPSEPGRAEDGGVPVPGGGADTDRDGIADAEEPPSDPAETFIPELGIQEAFFPAFAEFQALEFRVVGADFDSIYCYAGLNGEDNRYGPFDPMGDRRWDIAEYLGGNNSQHLAIPQGQPLRLHVECYGNRRSPFGGGFMAHVFDLGTINQQHFPPEWDGRILIHNSSGSAEGYSFDIKYRICNGSCASPNYQSPWIRLSQRHFPPPTRYTLRWTWSGDRSSIEGFRIYINGSRVLTADRNAHSADLTSMRPHCDETRRVFMTVVRRDSESPPSNIYEWRGGSCSRTVRVTFDILDTHIGGPNPPGPRPLVGPIRGSLWVNEQRVDYDNSHKLTPDHDYPVADWLTPNNTFTVVLDQGEDLTVGGTVIDKDRIGRDDTLFSAEHTFPANANLPAQYTLSNRLMKLKLKIEVLDQPEN